MNETSSRNVRFFNLYNNLTWSPIRLARSFVNNDNDAMDIIQNALLRAIENFDTLRDESKFAPWFRTIICNEAKKMIKVNRITFDGIDSIDIADESLPEASELIIKNSLSDELLEAVKALPDRARKAVVYRTVYDMTFVEIGRALGCSSKYAQVVYARALKSLKIYFKNSEFNDVFSG